MGTTTKSTQDLERNMSKAERLWARAQQVEAEADAIDLNVGNHTSRLAEKQRLKALAKTIRDDAQYYLAKVRQ